MGITDATQQLNTEPTHSAQQANTEPTRFAQYASGEPTIYPEQFAPTNHAASSIATNQSNGNAHGSSNDTASSTTNNQSNETVQGDYTFPLADSAHYILVKEEDI